MKETHNFIDPWRARYDTLRRYTWFKTNPVKKARLDYFLISSELMAFVEKVNISPGYRSDHSVIELTLSLLDFDKGRGFWKFNNSLLRDDNYIKLVKDTITTVKKQYMASPYNPLHIYEISNENLVFQIDDQLFFEQLLMNVRGVTIGYCSRKKKEREAQVKTLEEEITQLEITRNNDNSTETEENLNKAKQKLEDIRKEYIKGLFVRTKAKWIEEGEKPTKYFLSLEKRNYINKTVYKLIQDSGNIITEWADILAEIENYAHVVMKTCMMLT